MNFIRTANSLLPRRRLKLPLQVVLVTLLYISCGATTINVSDSTFCIGVDNQIERVIPAGGDARSIILDLELTNEELMSLLSQLESDGHGAITRPPGTSTSWTVLRVRILGQAGKEDSSGNAETITSGARAELELLIPIVDDPLTADELNSLFPTGSNESWSAFRVDPNWQPPPINFDRVTSLELDIAAVIDITDLSTTPPESYVPKLTSFPIVDFAPDRRSISVTSEWQTPVDAPMIRFTSLGLCPAPQAVPSLSGTGILVLALLLSGGGLALLRTVARSKAGS